MSATTSRSNAAGAATSGFELGRLAVASLVVALCAAARTLLPSCLSARAVKFSRFPPAPVLEKSIPQLPIPQPQAPITPVPSGEKFVVKLLHVTGQTRFSEAELIAATGFKPDSELTLPELRAMASRITSSTTSDGYFVAQAYLPPRTSRTEP